MTALTLPPAERIAAPLTFVGVPLLVLALAAGLLPLPALLAAFLVVLVLLALLADRFAAAAAVIALGVVALVPIYAGRPVTGRLGFTPMTVMALVLLPAALARRRRVRWIAIDTAVAVLILLRVVAFLLNYAGGPGAAASVILSAALPYAVFRVLALRPDAPRQLAAVLVGAAGALSVIGLRERAGIPNPFFGIPGKYQFAQWARPELRLGAVRAEASFGHPIAFGMFLAFTLVLALAFALRAERVLTRVACFGLSGLIVLGLVATVSRGPLLAAVVGAVVYIASVVHRVQPLRMLALLGALVAVVLSTSALSTVQILQSQSSGDTLEAKSAAYRLEVLAVALDPTQFSLLGKETRDTGEVAGSLQQRTGLKSVDSEFALLYLSSGALALATLLGLVGLLIRTATRPRLGPFGRAWAVGMAAACLNFTTVALLTQEAELFWVGVAVVACIEQRRRTSAPAPATAS